MHGDQAGRDGGTEKDREENEALDDLEQDEDGRGCYQPLSKTNSEAADRVPSRTVNVLRRLDRKRTDGDYHGVENGAASPPTPASPPRFR